MRGYLKTVIDSSNIYQKLAALYQIDALADNPEECKESVFSPLIGEDIFYGAACTLAVLCYPNQNEIQKRLSLIDHLAAWSIKSSAVPRSMKRKEFRKIPAYDSLINVPDRRIKQNLAMASKRLDKRLKAASVAIKKISTGSTNFHDQLSLSNTIIELAKQHPRVYRIFIAEDQEDEKVDDVIGEFKKSVFSPSKSVIHIAIALYSHLANNVEMRTFDITTLLNTANDWLYDLIYISEVFRLNLKVMLPRGRINSGGQFHNIVIRRSETIRVLPYIDAISDNLGKKDIVDIMFPHFA